MLLYFKLRKAKSLFLKYSLLGIITMSTTTSPDIQVFASVSFCSQKINYFDWTSGFDSFYLECLDKTITPSLSHLRYLTTDPFAALAI